MKVLVCAAWPYASGVPHLGNLIGSLLSGDVFSRYYKMKGFDTIYVSGTDMHGTRIEYEAWKKGKDPKDLAFENHEKIKKIIKDWNIEFDNYTNTESEIHKSWVNHVFIKLNENGYLFKETQEVPYCKDCKRYLADRLIYGTCPYCGYEHAYGNQCERCGRILEPKELIDPHCAFCNGTNIEFRKTDTWFFDLPKLKKELINYVESHGEWLDNVKGMTNTFLKNLKPRPVSRDIRWGIKFPLDSSKVVYVWAEAALGYVSATKEINREKDFWFDDVKQIYCIGKDNITFHTILFPAQLMGIKEGYHLPDSIATTEYLNWIGNQKFSKSKGVGIFGDDAKLLMPIPYWRFYLLYSRPELKDVEFSWGELDKIVNKILVENVINFVYRSLILGKRIGFEGKVEDEVESKIEETVSEVERLFEKTLIGKALHKICELAEFGNKYLQSKQPWKNKDKEAVLNSLYLSKAITIMLYPYIPSISEKISRMFEIKIRWEEIKNKRITVGKVDKILGKVDVKEVRKMYENIRKRVGIETFRSLGLKIGKIISCERINDRLLKLEVDVGKEKRQLVAGLGKFYSPEELVGKKVVVATNLKPKEINGILSDGMILGTKSGKILEIEGEVGEDII